MIALEATENHLVEVFDEVRRGRPVMVIGRRHGGDRGVLVAAADRLSLDTMNFMVGRARGPLYAMLAAQRLAELRLTPASASGGVTPPGGYFLPVNWSGCTTTGLSATDRLETIRRLAAADSTPADFFAQGQVTPIGARAGGVLERAGYTEAAVDIVRLASLSPAAAGCLVLSGDGNLADLAQLRQFAGEHDLAMVSIGDIITHRRTHECVLKRTHEVSAPLQAGAFRAMGYRDRYEPGEHLALLIGDLDADDGAVPVHLHAECVNGDVFGSTSCDCSRRLTGALEHLSTLGRGVLIYMRAAKGDTARFVHRPLLTGADAITVDDRVPEEMDQARDGVVRSILTDLGINERAQFLDVSS